MIPKPATTPSAHPKGETKQYLQWVYSHDAQKIVLSSDYIPLPQTEPVKGKAALARVHQPGWVRPGGRTARLTFRLASTHPPL